MPFKSIRLNSATEMSSEHPSVKRRLEKIVTSVPFSHIPVCCCRCSQTAEGRTKAAPKASHRGAAWPAKKPQRTPWGGEEWRGQLEHNGDEGRNRELSYVFVGNGCEEAQEVDGQQGAGEDADSDVAQLERGVAQNWRGLGSASDVSWLGLHKVRGCVGEAGGQAPQDDQYSPDSRSVNIKISFD